ncbi:AbrB/MazE/SpoVT family DNA-binding domain-containing protein [Rhodopila sp.]|uniref:AbrB/MazE/SpoVT family DNA-binding domain-containing protein n=1 Tax=Rhodopila sp. TaxID=2480087 RepID=UPI003D1164E8
MSLVRLRRAAQITLPQDIRAAAQLKEGDYLEAEVTAAGTIILKPVSIAGREPTPEQEADILAAVDEARAFHAAKRRR